MDDFFAVRPVPEPAPPERLIEPHIPEWFAPPQNVIPGHVASDIVMARSNDAAVVLSSIAVYPSGLLLSLDARVRPSDDEFRQTFQAMFQRMAAFTGAGASDDLLRFGVRFADGSKVTNVDRPPLEQITSSEDASTSGPVLMPHGGGGGMGMYDGDYWLWPRPTTGPVSVVCEWPAHDIDVSTAEIDMDAVNDAAMRAIELWPDRRPASGGRSFFGRGMPFQRLTGLPLTPDEDAGDD